MFGSLFHWAITNPTLAIAMISAMMGAVSAVLALRTYNRNANTKRAEFLLQLHKAFFVDSTYKPIRDLLDNPSDAEKLRGFIQEETAELTDFLNFFELIAYFEACKTLRSDDVDALLSYYLHLIKANLALSAYIGKDQTSFENLNQVVKRLE